LTLANTLPRLTALEELVATVYDSTVSADYGESDTEYGGDSWDSDTEDESFWEAYWAGDEFTHALPIPAAPLLAALPNLRRCDAAFVRSNHDRSEGYSFVQHCRPTPMLIATPAELAALHAPRLERLFVGLVASSDAEGEAWRCGLKCRGSDDDSNGAAAQASGAGQSSGVAADAPAGATTAAPASSGIGCGAPLLQSLELDVGCCAHASRGDGSLWDLSGLAPGSLPALRRLLVLPTSYKCRAAKLPLDAVARAAPRLERFVIDPRCAGPLDALFCGDDGGCALSLRGVVVLPALAKDAAAPARIDAQLRSGLRARAASAGAAAPIKVTLLVSDIDPHPGAPVQLPVSSEYARGATVVQRQLNQDDEAYVECFASPGPLLCWTLPGLLLIPPAEFEREYL
jgi:hypothetical protein